MLIYLLKANIILALLYAFYRLLFYRDTFFNCRRLSLMGIIAVSLLAPLPLLQPLTGGWPVAGNIPVLTAEVLLPGFIVTPDTTPSGNGQWAVEALSWIYIAGVCLMLGRIAVQLAGIARLSRRCPQIRLNGTEVYALPEGEAPFSFFRRIFVCPGTHRMEELDEILTHEQTHARQWHSADVMASELLCAFCWFNPFAWLLKREIRQNLEYLADRRVLAAGYDKKSYQYHLLKLTDYKAAATLYNHFNVLPLKKRISMMNKKRTNHIGRLKYLLFLPVAALLTMACNGTKAEQEATSTETVNDGQTATVVVESPPVDTPVAPNENSPVGPVYDTVEEAPQFPGGYQELMSFLAKNIEYPTEAVQQKTEGKVICQFVVTSEGKITDVKVVRGVTSALDQEAVRVLECMPDWVPGKQDGKAVNVRFVIPINFKLQGT